MQDKTPEQARHTELMKKIDALKVPLSAIALVGLVDEFYTKTERTELYKEYEALSLADEEARAVLFSKNEADNVEEIDEPGTVSRHELALRAKMATSDKLSAFIKKHPMIFRLIVAKNEVGKGNYE